MGTPTRASSGDSGMFLRSFAGAAATGGFVFGGKGERRRPKGTGGNEEEEEEDAAEELLVRDPRRLRTFPHARSWKPGEGPAGGLHPGRPARQRRVDAGSSGSQGRNLLAKGTGSPRGGRAPVGVSSAEAFGEFQADARLRKEKNPPRSFKK